MIHVDFLMERYDRSQLDSIADAFKLLHDLGVFIAQADANRQQVTTSFESEDPAMLAQRILEVRQTNRTLLALHELGQSMKEGTRHAQS